MGGRGNKMSFSGHVTERKSWMLARESYAVTVTVKQLIMRNVKITWPRITVNSSSSEKETTCGSRPENKQAQPWARSVENETSPLSVRSNPPEGVLLPSRYLVPPENTVFGQPFWFVEIYHPRYEVTHTHTSTNGCIKKGGVVQR